MIEGALQHVVVRRETGRMPDEVFAGASTLDSAATDVPVPIEDVLIGDRRIARASCAWPWPQSREAIRFRNKRARPEAFGGAGRLMLNGGPYKSLHIPTPVLVAPVLDFFVVGDRARLEDLLGDVTGIGRDAARGVGGVERWEVTPEQIDRSLVFQRRPMRPLPIVDGGPFDAHHFEPDSFERRMGTLRAPYWREHMRVPLIAPIVEIGEGSWWASVVREEAAAPSAPDHVNRAPGAAVRWALSPIAIERYRRKIERVTPERAEQAMLWHLRRARPLGAGAWEGPRPLSLRFQVVDRGELHVAVDVQPGEGAAAAWIESANKMPSTSRRNALLDEAFRAPAPDTIADWFATVDDLPKAPAGPPAPSADAGDRDEPMPPIAPVARGGARGRFFITPYAVARYLERVRPSLATRAALEELIGLTSDEEAVCKGDYLWPGLRAAVGPDVKLELWRGPRRRRGPTELAQSRIRFVVAYAPGEQADHLPQVITVLPLGERRGRGAT
jgi:hypothetical protein